MQPQQPNALDDLNNVIDFVTAKGNIVKYIKHKGDFTRNRKLTPDILLKVILNMEGNSLNAELFKAFPDVDERVTVSAFEQAKGKLCPEIFKDILQAFNKTATREKLLDDKYRVYAIDGSDFKTPFNPDSELLFFKKNINLHKRNNSLDPYCMIHANLLYDLMNCTYQDCIFQPRMQEDERGAAIEMINRLDTSKPFIVIMDRGYEGLNLFETLNPHP